MGFRKRGQLTSTQIIMIVLAILGFVILMIFLVGIGFEEFSEKEICHLSVITRATTQSVVEGQLLVPLKCTTEKICLTDGSGKCEKQFAGEKNVIVIKLKGSVEEKRRKIEEVSANAMYDCWSMMGQGKLDLFTNIKTAYGLAAAESTCIICSRVAIDEEVDSKILYENEKKGVNINKYLKENQVPGSSLTYLQTFTDRGINAFAKFDETDFNENVPEGEFKIDGGVEEVNRELAFVFFQIKSISIGNVLKKMGKAGGTMAGAVFMTPILGKFAGKLLLTPAGAVLAIVGVTGIGGYGAYNAYQGQLVSAGYCGNFTTTDEKAKEGCSLVQGVNYNFKDINKICGRIEGNP